MLERKIKTKRMMNLMKDKGLDAIVLKTVANVAWATEGRQLNINIATDLSDAAVIYTAQGKRYFITTNNEATRFLEEEGIASQEWDVRVENWYEPGKVIGEIIKGLKVGSDIASPDAVDIFEDLIRLRSVLAPEEQTRFKQLGKLSADAMWAIIRSLKPGQSELQIAACLAKETIERGIFPTVIQVAVDKRAYLYQHVPPTALKLKKFVIISFCARKSGLICSMSRLVHFGTPPGDLQKKVQAAAAIDALLIANARPNVSYLELFKMAVDAYQKQGFAPAWMDQHKGGSAGYGAREFLLKPGSKEVVRENEAYAFNPTVRGGKSEDTILIGKKENIILTRMPGFPTISVLVNGQVVKRPDILVI